MAGSAAAAAVTVAVVALVIAVATAVAGEIGAHSGDRWNYIEDRNRETLRKRPVGPTATTKLASCQ